MVTVVTGILDTVHNLGVKCQNVSETASAPVFRWEKHTGESVLLGALERITLNHWLIFLASMRNIENVSQKPNRHTTILAFPQIKLNSIFPSPPVSSKLTLSFRLSHNDMYL
jgi:hypothetical protein